MEEGGDLPASTDLVEVIVVMEEQPLIKEAVEAGLAGDMPAYLTMSSTVSLEKAILYFPMLVFSGTTLPIEVMPKAMQKMVSVFPLTQGLTMMKNTFLGTGTGSILLPLCVMIGVAALCTILAVRFFRWE